MEAALSHYRILGQIGAGGMGVVYRAHDEQLQRDVALKVLPLSTFTDPAARARLLREARSAAALNHPHICTVYEVGEDDGQAYIAMELVQGTTLSARLTPGPMSADDVTRLGTQLSDALAHAHERGIVHRDLKSANIVITHDGRAKILDFGLAKRLSREVLDEVTRSEESLTAPGTVAGTLAYMAPEQLRGQPGDEHSDIWALGVVLYEMATGKLPFRGQTGYEVSSAILDQPPRELPSKLPLELRAVIGRCLEKDPGRRYQRAGEVRAALEAIRAGEVSWAAWRYALARRRWLMAAASIALLLLIVAAANYERIRTRVLGGVPRVESLAVLPLENLSGDPEQDYLADGVHEALITDLAKLGGIKRVIARSSVMGYRKTSKPLSQIAKELGVDALISGSVLRSGDRVQITAHLIQASSEQQLWGDRYERQLRDVLSLQNDIVSAITQAIRLQLSPQEKARLATARPVNPEAYEAYLKGKFYLNKYTPEGFQKGLAYLQEAIKKDPMNPLPYAELALGYGMMGHEQAPETFPLARAAALKALQLDESLAEAHEALAEIKLYQDWDWPGAEQSFRRALEINPNLAQGHVHYSWYLQLVRPLDEAIAEMERARELDPLTPLWSAWLGWQYWEAGRSDKAIDAAQKSLELDPNFPVGLYILGAAYAQKGMYPQAIAAHRKAGVASSAWRWPLGYTYALAGQWEAARRVAAELEKEPVGLNPWGLAEIYTALGEKDAAFRWLEVCFSSHAGYMPWIRIEIPYKPLRSDPRFQDLVRRMNLPKS
ncbi:MAG: protein kinase [Acidobacteriia bacterium]|nr:protein kinase [Terriglobia bacterium]